MGWVVGVGCRWSVSLTAGLASFLGPARIVPRVHWAKGKGFCVPCTVKFWELLSFLQVIETLLFGADKKY